MASPRPVTDADFQNPVFLALKAGIGEMRRSNVGRVVLSIGERNDIQIKDEGGFLTQKHFAYYPNSILPAEERDLIRRQRPYEVIALLASDMGGMLERPIYGLEVRQRNHGKLRFMPRMAEGSQLNWQGNAFIYESDRDLALVARDVLNHWKPEDITAAVRAGIQEWRQQTNELVSGALERMTPSPPPEQLVRETIEQARKRPRETL